jgi:hypothetical protein
MNDLQQTAQTVLDEWAELQVAKGYAFRMAQAAIAIAMQEMERALKDSMVPTACSRCGIESVELGTFGGKAICADCLGPLL